MLEAWACDGLTDDQIAGNIGISRSTLAEWKKKYSDISDALKKGKKIVDTEVENALLKRALGYDYTETSKKYKNGKLVEEKVITKHVAGDVTAQIFWLKNRKPGEWRDKIQYDNEAEVSRVDDLIKAIDKVAKS